MKKIKYLIILLPLFITGCFGLDGSGNLVSTCTKKEIGYGMEEKDTYTIEYYQGDISKITLLKEYVGVELTDSLLSYQKAYENRNGVHITVGDSSIKYAFDMEQINDEIKSNFNLKDTYTEQVKYLNSIGFTCE